MNFWDRFVRAVVFGLATEPAVGRGVARRTLELAFVRGRLTPDALDDTSLLLLLAFLPESSPFRAAVLTAALTGQLHLQTGAHQLLRDAAQPRLEELVELGRAAGHQFRGLVAAALWEPGAGVVERVGLYLGRIWHIDPDEQPLRTIARGLVAETARRFATIPPGTYEFLGYLFRRVRAQTRAPGEPFPVVFPPRRPRLQEPDERRFVEACMLDLVEPAVDVLYLHFYAGLTVGQIAQALRLLQLEGAEDAIVRRIEECWEIVL